MIAGANAVGALNPSSSLLHRYLRECIFGPPEFEKQSCKGKLLLDRKLRAGHHLPLTAALLKYMQAAV
jgi:hypothetical protein